MSLNNDDDASKLIRDQQARAKLRESFLRAIYDLNGRSCSILNYEETLHNASFAGWNPDGSEILVKNLATPTCGIINSALVRAQDILAIQFEGPV